uniref:Uncharacterized protein n=1 Tax=Cajanus cajan TaxID=3821 RepID=A0A151S230_CAJCA|nr:hypothetical protein KK1_029370 [Cajanus cajan]
MAGSTWEVRSEAGRKPLPAACGEAGNPKNILLAGIPDIHCFHASSRLLISPEVYWQGGLL